jgi:hypothetical protein
MALSIYQLKPAFQQGLRPAVTLLHGWGVTANQVTLAACALSVALGLALYALPLAPAWFALLALVAVRAHGAQRHRRHAGARVRPTFDLGRLPQRTDRRGVRRRAVLPLRGWRPSTRSGWPRWCWPPR